MAGAVERCVCGAEIEISDVHYTQVVAFVNRWRDLHECKGKPVEFENAFVSVDTGRSELPMGFTRGLRVDGPDVDVDEDPENKRRRKK